MRRILKNFMVLAVVFSIMVFVSCGSGSGSSGSKKMSIGLSLPTQREARWVNDKMVMENVAKELGIDLKVQVADSDMAQQSTQIESLIGQNIQVLILAPVDAAASATLVSQARKKGIRVIAYDRIVLNEELDLYITFDNEKIGELQGEWLTKKVPKGNYIVMSGDPGDDNSVLLKRGAMKFIQPLVEKGDIRIVADQAVANWLPTNALTIVEQALTANKNRIDAILAPNDGTAGGAIQALASQKLVGKILVTGQDSETSAAKRINDGTQGMTIFKDTRELGRAAIEIAFSLASGKNVADVEYNGFKADKTVNNKKRDIPSLFLPAYVITKENLHLLVDSGYLEPNVLQ